MGMKKTVHVATKYVIEWNRENPIALNRDTEDFRNILDAFDIDRGYYGDESDVYEYDARSLDYFIWQLKRYLGNEDSDFTQEEINEVFEDTSYTPEVFLELLEQIQKEADTSDGYYHFLDF